jgi:hypothetical protein
MGAVTAAPRRAPAAALLAILGVLGLAQPAPAQDDEYRRIFEQILQDPANPQLNLRYAKLAIDRGELSRAQAAYERILERDPNNREALEGLRRVKRQLEPTITQFTVSVGPQWDSNPRRLRQSAVTHGDIAFNARATVSDERPVFDWRWRSEGTASTIYWGTFRDIDIAAVAGRTGPVFALGETMRFHPFLGMSYTVVRRRTFATEPSAGATIELDDFGPLRSVTARWGYVFVGRAFSERDATFVEVYPRLIVSDLGLKGSTAVVIPFWRYTGVFGSGSPGDDPRNTPFPARQHQFGVRGDYFIPVLQRVTLGLFATAEYRHYFERIPGETKNRRDFVIAPGAQFILTSLFVDQLDVVGSYTFEWRHSNDGLQNYNNHSLSLRWIWRF